MYNVFDLLSYSARFMCDSKKLIIGLKILFQLEANLCVTKVNIGIREKTKRKIRNPKTDLTLAIKTSILRLLPSA